MVEPVVAKPAGNVDGTRYKIRKVKKSVVVCCPFKLPKPVRVVSIKTTNDSLDDYLCNLGQEWINCVGEGVCPIMRKK